MEKKYLEILSRTLLFRSIPAAETEAILAALGAEEKTYARGEVILHAGDVTDAIALVLAGSVLVESNDWWGNKSILDRPGPGQVFAETYACAPGQPLLVSAVAAEPASILFLHTGALLRGDGIPAAQQLLRNLLAVFSRKNLHLSRRMFHTAPRSIRRRVQLFLSDQAMFSGAQEFDIPFDRQQLADYLNTDRSALSAELSRMQKEGLLTVRKNHFRLLSGGETAER